MNKKDGLPQGHDGVGLVADANTPEASFGTWLNAKEHGSDDRGGTTYRVRFDADMHVSFHIHPKILSVGTSPGVDV